MHIAFGDHVATTEFDVDNKVYTLVPTGQIERATITGLSAAVDGKKFTYHYNVMTEHGAMYKKESEVSHSPEGLAIMMANDCNDSEREFKEEAAKKLAAFNGGDDVDDF